VPATPAAPNLTIRDQIAAAVDATNPGTFYRGAGVLADLIQGPFRSVLNAETFTTPRARTSS
jgi:hypothetical protein